jgi:hypothetical protein
VIDALANNNNGLVNYQLAYKQWVNAKHELEALRQKSLLLQKKQITTNSYLMN